MNELLELWRKRAVAFEEVDKLHGADVDCIHSILVTTEEVKQIAKALDIVTRNTPNQAGS